MAITSAKLVDGAIESVIYPRADLHLFKLDASSPAIRVVAEERADGDGEVDTTERHGGRAVSIELLATDTPGDFEEELNFFIRPAARPYLVVKREEWAQYRRLRLRCDQWSAPLLAENAPHVMSLQYQWRAPDGVWEDISETSFTARANLPATVGITFPITFPITFTPSTSSEPTQTVNVGNAPCHIVAKLYGPCSAPRLTNETTGEVLAFSESLTLGVGEYVEVDTQARTAQLNSVPGLSSSRLSYVDFGVSTWWQLQPGLQQVRYAPTTPTADTQAVITFRPRWL